MSSPRRRRAGMTFFEILFALAILTFGIIPIVHHITSATRQTRISLRQVQAANHAANLLEALRSLGYQKLRAMPACKVQLRGNENRWDNYSSGMDLSLEGIVDDGLGDPGIFGEFETRFFGEPAVVPELESLFTRYYYLIRQEGRPYVTIVVRVEWPSRQLGPPNPSGETSAPRHVELRTVMADPFRGGSGGGGGGQAGEEPGSSEGAPE